MQWAEKIFGTEKDPNQMPVNEESVKKLDAIYSGWLETKLNENNEPISWSVVMPTQKSLADKFLDNEITEKEILELTKPQAQYDALYLVSVITIPDHRNRGLASELLLNAIKKSPIIDDALIFAWPTSLEGKSLTKKVSSFLNREIKFRI